MADVMTQSNCLRWQCRRSYINWLHVSIKDWWTQAESQLAHQCAIKGIARALRNSELYAQSRIRSFKSQILIQDAKSLFRTVTQCSSFELTQRLMAQSTFSTRYPGRIVFMNYGKKRVARNSFINRAKQINDAIPFDWLDLSPKTFEVQLKRSIPLDIQWLNCKKWEIFRNNN